MGKRFIQEMERLHEKLLGLSVMVESKVKQAIKALEERDMNLARIVIESDVDIDNLEVEIEEDCLKTLALYQPVAEDLRYLVATIKINNDLERIGDEAVNIAERALVILKYPSINLNLDFKIMTNTVDKMLRLSLDSLVYRDIDIAYKVCLMDDTVDGIYSKNYEILKDALNSCKHRAGLLINTLLVFRHLERIADHATNIAEEVIYILEGEIPRHKNL